MARRWVVGAWVGLAKAHWRRPGGQGLNSAGDGFAKLVLRVAAGPGGGHASCRVCVNVPKCHFWWRGSGSRAVPWRRPHLGERLVLHPLVLPRAVALGQGLPARVGRPKVAAVVRSAGVPGATSGGGTPTSANLPWIDLPSSRRRQHQWGKSRARNGAADGRTGGQGKEYGESVSVKPVSKGRAGRPAGARVVGGVAAASAAAEAAGGGATAHIGRDAVAHRRRPPCRGGRAPTPPPGPGADPPFAASSLGCARGCSQKGPQPKCGASHLLTFSAFWMSSVVHDKKLPLCKVYAQ